MIVPAGFELFGWHWFEGVTTDAPSNDSAIHLIGLEDIVYSANDTTKPSKVNMAICGQAPRGRGRFVDGVGSLKDALEDHSRRPCSACFRQASEDMAPAPPPQARHKGMTYDLAYAQRRTSGHAKVDPTPTKDDAA